MSPAKEQLHLGLNLNPSVWHIQVMLERTDLFLKIGIFLKPKALKFPS